MKDKIQLMEMDQAKSKIETEEFMQKHKSIMSQKLIENFDNEPKLMETEIEKNGNGHIDEKNGHENGKIVSDMPPKPLPRKSISDKGSFDENSSFAVPKPQPRTASYKVFVFSLCKALRVHNFEFVSCCRFFFADHFIVLFLVLNNEVRFLLTFNRFYDFFF